ncbi:MAG: ABC transporter substrate-binding protein [Sphingomonadaceae bacterium]
MVPWIKSMWTVRTRSGRIIACAGLLLAGAFPAPLHAQGQGAARANTVIGTPRKIISLNLCADQYLLALADPGQIAGLTPNANDPEMSAAAAQTRGLRILGRSAEEVLVIDPDLVVGETVRRSAVMMALKEKNYPALDLRMADSFADIVAQTRKVAHAIGHPARGEALVSQMEQELAKLGKPGRGRVAAYYQRRGFMTGTGTLVDDLMQRVGLVNLASKLGKPALSQLSIEELVAAQPDFMIVETSTDDIADQGTEMLHHPALRDIPRIRLPHAWTVCGGPAYVRAAQSLAAQIGIY